MRSHGGVCPPSRHLKKPRRRTGFFVSSSSATVWSCVSPASVAHYQIPDCCPLWLQFGVASAHSQSLSRAWLRSQLLPTRTNSSTGLGFSAPLISTWLYGREVFLNSGEFCRFMFACHRLWGGWHYGLSWVEAIDDAKHLTVHPTALDNKELSDLKWQGDEI